MDLQVNIGEAKTRLSALVAATVRGDTVILSKAGEPQVRVVPVTDAAVDVEMAAAKRRAAIGIWRDAFEGYDTSIAVLKADHHDPDERFRRKFGPADYAHVLIWAVEGSHRLSARAHDMLVDPANWAVRECGDGVGFCRSEVAGPTARVGELRHGRRSPGIGRVGRARRPLETRRPLARPARRPDGPYADRSCAARRPAPVDSRCDDPELPHQNLMVTEEVDVSSLRTYVHADPRIRA